MLDSISIKMEAMVELGIEPYEYMVANSIYKLGHKTEANKGWCTASKQYLAECYGLSRVSVSSIISRLVSKGIVERRSNKSRAVRATKIWEDTVVLRKAYQGKPAKELDVECKDTLHLGVNKADTQCKESLHLGVNKADTECKESLHPIDNKIYPQRIDRDMTLLLIEDRVEKLSEEMSANQLHLEAICMNNRLDMKHVMRMITPWAKENASTSFQNSNHKKNSFKKYVLNAKVTNGSEPATITGSKPMIKPGETRRYTA